MQYDLGSAIGLVAATGLLVQFLKNSTPVAKYLPLWLIVILISAVLMTAAKLLGIITGNIIPIGFNVIFNAMASSGVFTWVSGQAGRKDAPTDSSTRQILNRAGEEQARLVQNLFLVALSAQEEYV